jgi:hypothetical protein
MGFYNNLKKLKLWNNLNYKTYFLITFAKKFF